MEFICGSIITSVIHSFHSATVPQALMLLRNEIDSLAEVALYATKNKKQKQK